MYSRRVGGKVCSFEASGGLIHGSLVMQDRETNTYWELMKSVGIAGPLRGKHLKKLPAVKTQWRDWLKSHPKTVILSVNGREDSLRDPYANYVKSSKGFRGLEAADDRLATKASLLALTLGKRHVAVPHEHLVGGAVFSLGGSESLFAHRPEGASLFRSTRAFLSRGAISRKRGTWVHLPSGAQFDPTREVWVKGRGELPRAVTGFDTFWVTWSLAHPETLVLTPKGVLQAPKRAKPVPPTTRPAPSKELRWF
ncbi:MAG: DUF3179 domain-containing protein [Planctomycetes bacterium]|nr:DUF3179 domain-containing protein [Planctomycetota bacterium]